MTLYKLYESCNGREPWCKGIFLTKELAQDKADHPTRSEHAEQVDGKWHMVKDVYTFTIEEFEWDKELTFDIYIICPKNYYSLRGQRISGLSWDKANELYNEYSEREYVELQLPQKQFGETCITKVKSNVDSNYWKLQESWGKEQSEDPMNYPENEPAWLR